MVAVTAWQMLFEHGNAKPSQTVMILGAAGNVGEGVFQWLTPQVGTPLPLNDVRTAHEMLGERAWRRTCGPARETRRPKRFARRAAERAKRYHRV